MCETCERSDCVCWLRKPHPSTLPVPTAPRPPAAPRGSSGGGPRHGVRGAPPELMQIGAEMLLEGYSYTQVADHCGITWNQARTLQRNLVALKEAS